MTVIKLIPEDRAAESTRKMKPTWVSEIARVLKTACNLARLGKSWIEFNFFQACMVDLWYKMKTAIETTGTAILMKELK